MRERNDKIGRRESFLSLRIWKKETEIEWDIGFVKKKIFFSQFLIFSIFQFFSDFLIRPEIWKISNFPIFK